MFKKSFFAAAIAAALTASIAATPVQAAESKLVQTAAAQSVVVTQAWVRASSFSDHINGMTGVFAKITNRTKKTVTLTGGSSSFAPMVQVHQVVDGMMSEKPGGIEIAPGKSIILQPGGLHVMLMGLKKSVLPGSRVDLKLSFKNYKTIALKLIAKTADAGDEEYFKSK